MTPEEKKRADRKAYQQAYRQRPYAKAKQKAVQATPEMRARSNAYGRQWRSGITPELFDKLMVFQGGQCAICERPIDRKTARGDHDHKAKRPRGLLCQNCNIAEGNVAKTGLDAEVFGYRLARYYSANPVKILDARRRVGGFD